MCSRARQVFGFDDLRTNFRTVFGDDFPPPINPEPRWNAAPRQHLVIVRVVDGVPDLVKMEWGFVPNWERDSIGARRPVNATAETIAANLQAGRGMWADAFRRRRCILPVNGFYEWKQVGKHKLPYAIDRADGQLMGLAALWDRWTDRATGEILTSFAVITVPPNELMATIHDRMPAILDPADYDIWLTGTPEAALALCRPCPVEWLKAYRVSDRVGNVRNDGPELIVPVPEDVALW